MRRKYLILAAFMMVVLIGPGCKKFLDVNKNPNDPTPAGVTVSMILSAAERNISNNLALGTGMGNVMGVYTHQITGRVAADRYGAGAQSWEGLYAAVANLNVIIARGTEEGRLVYRGIAKVLKAYVFSVLVDVYGDVPFSEFDRFEEGVLQPNFDKGSDIYPQLFTLIDEGIADISDATPNPTYPGNDDYIYKGNRERWVKSRQHA